MTTKSKRDADELNRSLQQAVNKYEIIADMKNRKTAVNELSKKIVSAWKGGGGA